MFAAYKETLDLADINKQNERKAFLNIVAQRESSTSMYLDAVGGIRPYSDLEHLLSNAYAA